MMMYTHTHAHTHPFNTNLHTFPLQRPDDIIGGDSPCHPPGGAAGGQSASSWGAGGRERRWSGGPGELLMSQREPTHGCRSRTSTQMDSDVDGHSGGRGAWLNMDASSVSAPAGSSSSESITQWTARSKPHFLVWNQAGSAG